MFHAKTPRREGGKWIPAFAGMTVVIALLLSLLLGVQTAGGTEVCYQINKQGCWPTNPDSLWYNQTIRVAFSMAEEVFRKGQAVPPDSVFFYYTPVKVDEDTLYLDWYCRSPMAVRDSTLLLSTVLKPEAGKVTWVPLAPTWMPFTGSFLLYAATPDSADTNIVKNSGFVFRWYK